MKSEREESLGYDNREPKGQEEYAKTQHDLCCQELGLEPRHDRPGDTLLEAVCALKKDRDEARRLAVHWRDIAAGQFASAGPLPWKNAAPSLDSENARAVATAPDEPESN
jgi:hypothetical protein